MSERHTPYFNLLEALQAPGCPLCRIGNRAAHRYLERVLYDSVTDPQTRATLVAAHGFCPTHGERLVERHDALGSAIIYRSILKHLEGELAGLAEEGALSVMTRLRERWQKEALLEAHDRCPACLERDRSAERAVKTFAAHHQDEELHAALGASPGLCLSHLQQALSLLSGPARILLLERQQAAWASLHGELDELIRKHDHRFSDEAIGAEGDAWQRAVRLVSGEPDVF